MRVLVTGGSGVIGAGVIPQLLSRGYTVRLLSRGATGESEAWPTQVEPFPADVSDAASLAGCAEGCDAVVHVTGIESEEPPEVTFESVNVQGTANVLAEAKRAGAPQFVYLSSLGVDRGESEYHQSKLRAEDLVREYPGSWLILRPGNVYGPGDKVLSLIVKMVRALPAVPLVGRGDHEFQPLWYEDLGRAITDAVERDDLRGQTLELAGSETTSMKDVIERIGRAIGTSAAAIPVPVAAVALATELSERLGFEFPLTEAKLAMLLEGNRIGDGQPNALTETFGIEPVKLDEGLPLLAQRIPETSPKDGVGALERKRFWADIEGSELSPEEMIRVFRREYHEILPIDFGVEGEAAGELREGESLSAALPVRGHIQIRVEEVKPRHVTFATVEGHPLAGIVRFVAEPRRGATRFLIEIHTRAASWFDLLAMKLGGDVAQRLNWEVAVGRMVERSGGTAPAGVEHDREKIDERKAGTVERWIDRLVTSRRRHQNEDLTRDRARP